MKNTENLKTWNNKINNTEKKNVNRDLVGYTRKCWDDVYCMYKSWGFSQMKISTKLMIQIFDEKNGEGDAERKINRKADRERRG